jgi:hypothetical protein
MSKQVIETSEIAYIRLVLKENQQILNNMYEFLKKQTSKNEELVAAFEEEEYTRRKSFERCLQILEGGFYV